MIGGRASFILLSTLAVIQTLDVPSKISLTEVDLGDSVTLTCKPSKHYSGLLYWFRMKFGYMFETVAMGTFQTPSLQGQFNTSKFKVFKDHSLTIRNVSKEDEAMYFCQAGAAYQMSFVNGTHLAVNDPQNKQKTVKLSSDVELVSLGNKINLQCSFLKESPRQCPDEDRVFWYRAGSESEPGFIYADKSSCDKQSGRRCVSRLSKIIQNPSDAGNDYCAVATCGEILFGEGTKVEIREQWGLPVIVLGTLLALSVIVIAILVCARD
ncbi:roundabout homolog 3-like [Melanotaenia boesemani]|uniref:roundabout homolog 3-like n=1 Tax=Melanotaenia boesemani TaxID=1250792 RepID=UPI001C047E8C|nr:roundabout homolog 3-like [Melanotaenia boesemani]